MMNIEFKWGASSGSTYSVDGNDYHRCWTGTWYKGLYHDFDRSKEDREELEAFHKNLTQKLFKNEIDKIFHCVKHHYNTPEYIEYLEEKMRGLKYEL